MESRTRPGPANLRHHNSVMACLREAGFSFKMAVHAYNALDSYTYGVALQEKSLLFETPEESAEVAEMMLPPSLADEYPYLVEVVVELGRWGYNYTEEFELALDVILDGIERLRQQELTSTGGRQLIAGTHLSEGRAGFSRTVSTASAAAREPGQGVGGLVGIPPGALTKVQTSRRLPPA